MRPPRSRAPRPDAARSGFSRRPRRPLPPPPVRRLTVNHVAGAVPSTTHHVRFGWQLTEVSAVVAVQVVVARTPDDARWGTPSVWDSGRRSVDDPDFSDVCLAATLGHGADEIALPAEIGHWWSVRVWGADGEVFGWSEPARLLRSATVGATPAPRALATVTGSLPTTAAQPIGDEGLYRWITSRGPAAIWPLVCSLDLAARVGPWLDRLRPQLEPGDRRGLALYAGLLEAADLCYDDPALHAEHGAALAALRRGAPRRQPAPAGSIGPEARMTTTTEPVGGFAPQSYGSGPTPGADPVASLGDLLAPLLGSAGAAAPLPVGIVVSEVAGLRATAPGFRRFRVEPCLLPQATEVDVEVETVRGPIVIRLRRRPDTLAGAQVTLGVPSGAVAKLVLPWSGEELTLDAGCYVFVND